MDALTLADRNPERSPAAEDWRRTFRPMNITECRLFLVLDALGEEIVPQARVGPWTVDFLLPRIRVVVESDSRMLRARATSTFCIPGPMITFLPLLPNVPATGTWNAAGLNHPFGLGLET